MKRKIFQFAFAVLVSTWFIGNGAPLNTTQQFHYIQKEGECKEITIIPCCSTGDHPCFALDPDDGTGPWRVNENRTNPATCDTPLFTDFP